MTERKITNLPASIRQRLLKVAQASNRPFQEVLQYYAMERFLFRLSVSSHVEKFILKGALMMTAWGAPATRPTRDIDLLGYVPNQVESLVEIIREVCCQEVEPDALSFDPTTATGIVIKADADYEGVRVTSRGSLQNMPIPMQIDIGFGDIVFPAPAITEYPVILNHARPKLRGYSRETTVAEKFEAMVKLGLLNSRMKDFFDVWLGKEKVRISTASAKRSQRFYHHQRQVHSKAIRFVGCGAMRGHGLMLTDQALQPPASATLLQRVALGWLHPVDEDGESGTEASGTKTSLCDALRELLLLTPVHAVSSTFVRFQWGNGSHCRECLKAHYSPSIARA